MARPQPIPKMSFEEFLVWEEGQELRHEYVAGEIRAMAGGSKNHNRVVLNIASSLLGKHADSGCRVYAENILLRLPEVPDAFGYYPDVMLVCAADDGPRESWSERPCALFEVLSDSTQHLDRGEKFRDYKTVATLMTYVLVSQQAAHVTVYRRAGGWQPEFLTRMTDVLTLDCAPEPPTALTLAEIYRGLGFDA